MKVVKVSAKQNKGIQGEGRAKTKREERVNFWQIDFADTAMAGLGKSYQLSTRTLWNNKAKFSSDQQTSRFCIL